MVAQLYVQVTMELGRKGAIGELEKQRVSKPHPLQRGRVWSCCNHQVVAVTNEIGALCELHPLSWSSNYVTCLVDVDCLIILFLSDNSSAVVWLPLSTSWQRVWLARVVEGDKSCQLCAMTK